MSPPVTRARKARHSTACDHCARADTYVQNVQVRPRRKHVPDVGSMALCVSCVKAQGATWRLRYHVAV